ncbi:3-deoxy-D-manno-octulosonic acid transferase [Pseudoalteromonas rubra]|uniref:3-deoxy-D-manno-octulosonic acid transferase n=1 Tax=Pseudoalteromonas rubra TaxID=43658 RepID=A0A5S3WNB5_9GAMM|nr:lipid IV(A) 3-deoxy-D-manno-octulosonic acid transferase [Pseudoalteromonas rubra]TMP29696.1 3-deoxy-D-manno-octulosonic acid transferase [Pseudoalteromonas rubra]TMP35290.1 3-deoxy-D-manno-octulosonic acid transferase [Pseudoalteromonas rubra]
MIRRLYSLLLLVLCPIIVAYLYVIRGKKNALYKANFSERFGVAPSSASQQAIMVHCASVGEVLAAAPLVRALLAEHPDTPFILTCNTPTGREQLAQLFAKEDQHITICYLPIDFAFATRRFINQLRPKLLLVLETELWPNLFYYAKKAACPVTVVNARLSKKSQAGYQKVAPLSQFLMDQIDMLASHNKEDAERFVELGLAREKVTVTGSIKFDISLDDNQQEKIDTIKAQLGARPVWVAGSTHPMEHEQVLAAHQNILAQLPDALLIIAPRHPEQFDKVAALIEAQALSYSRRSQQYKASSQVLLADTLGELKLLYGCGQIAYIGGSLIERGGHNPLEAAACSVGVLTGPHTYNFAHIYPELISMQGAIEVADPQVLADTLLVYLRSKQDANELGAHAKACLARNQGAIARSITMINALLEK